MAIITPITTTIVAKTTIIIDRSFESGVESFFLNNFFVFFSQIRK